MSGRFVNQAARRCAVIMLTAVFAAMGCPPDAVATFKVALKYEHVFKGGADGSYPAGVPVTDAKGNVYGVTYIAGDPICS
jgi:hypothetical protein